MNRMLESDFQHSYRRLRRGGKRLLGKVASIAWPLVAQSRQGSLLVLTYHRVLPVSETDAVTTQPGMVTSTDAFKLHLQLLKHQGIVVLHLRDWLERRRGGQPLPKLGCAITFDDGWADNYEHAFPLLHSENVPATIFLVSQYVDTKRAFWPERLARLVWNSGRGLSADVWAGQDMAWLRVIAPMRIQKGHVPTRTDVDHLIEAAKAIDDLALTRRLNETEVRLDIEQTPGAQPDLLSWDEVETMHKSGLIEFGSHGRTHLRLGERHSLAVLKEEIVESKGDIAEHLGDQPQLFCFPNGNYTPSALSLVSRHYRGACTTGRGWNGRRTSAYQLRRIGIHDDVSKSEEEFLFHISRP